MRAGNAMGNLGTDGMLPVKLPGTAGRGNLLHYKFLFPKYFE